MEKYILVSLNEKKSKELANVIRNPTVRKILDHLEENDQTTPIALSKKLKTPLSTVTYSLKKLEKEGLIEKKDFAWSEKGKKVWYYTIAKKMIIIVPKGIDWQESLKKILPVALIGFVTSFILKLTYRVPEIVTVDTAGGSLPVETIEEVVIAETITIKEKIISVNEFFSPEFAWLYVLIATLLIMLFLVLINLDRKKR